jgi:hypothetical protein
VIYVPVNVDGLVLNRQNGKNIFVEVDALRTEKDKLEVFNDDKKIGSENLPTNKCVL